LLATRLSTAEEIDRLKGELDELASRGDIMEIISMDHREPKVERFHEQYVVEIKHFESDMPGVLTMLDRLRRSEGMLRVALLSLTPGKGDWPAKGAMNVTKVMLLPDEPEQAAGPANAESETGAE
jgi:hypothetical protein